MRSLELFSGMGGLARGLEIAGFDHAQFVELDKHACNSLRSNFPTAHVFEGDVRKFDFQSMNDIDLVAGGPPCQPFSLGGKGKASADDRDMFPRAIEAINTLQPKAFLFENVKGLLRKSFDCYFDYIIKRLEFSDVGQGALSWEDDYKRLCDLPDFYKSYRAIYRLINAADYGVPQTRERVFILGVRNDLNITPSFPLPTHSKKSLEWEQFGDFSYWNRHKIEPDQNYTLARKLAEQPSLLEKPLKPWVTVRDALCHLPDPKTNFEIKDHEFRDGARSYPGHTGSYIDLPSKTIKAGVHGVPGGENMIRFHDGSIRYFTVHEAKLIQTFPEDFVVVGSWGEAMRQIGNAVPVQLGRIMGDHLSALVTGSKPMPKAA